MAITEEIIIIGVSQLLGARAYAYEWKLYGAVHKVRHARGEGVRKGVTVCDRGGNSRACDVTRLKIFIHMKPKIESDV